MTIPSVMHGLIEVESGKVFELNSPKGATWLESIGSFRFEPTGDNRPYTVRKETGKSGDYWYGYRKVAGRLHKKYIGKTSELNTVRLEEIAEALNTPPQPRVTDKVTEVTGRSERVVTEQVTGRSDGDRLTALELQVQALQESLEALRSELPGKSDAANSPELPIVTDSGLQSEIGNLQVTNLRLELEAQALREELENNREGISSQAFIIKDEGERSWKLQQDLEAARTDYTKLLESSSAIIRKSKEDSKILLDKLTQERVDREEVEAELADLKQNPKSDFDFVGKASDLKQWLGQILKKELPRQVTVKEIRKILEGS